MHYNIPMNPLDIKCLESTEVIHNKGQPYSPQFDDKYYDQIDGLAESNYVFIEGNQLKSNWQRHQDHPFFCIGETGFGIGLNFLATCYAWELAKEKPKHLHFISTELYPVPASELNSTHQNFPELLPYSKLLLKHYSSFRAGIHQIRINSQITLTLIFGDVLASLKQLNAVINAWFLDGFAPSRNPEMWSTELFNEIARLSQKETTFATFSSAAVVKKGLTQSGFVINKQPGFGAKREMLVGTLPKSAFPKINKQPWDPLPNVSINQQSVTIIGGGIAGLCLARSFHHAGFSTTLIDMESRPFSHGSGNGYAMVMPLITAGNSPESLFYLRAFEHASRCYGHDIFHQSGVLETYTDINDQKRIDTLKGLSLSSELLSTSEVGTRYQNSGFVDTQALLSEWQPYINQWIKADIQRIYKCNHQWQLFDQSQQLVHQTELLVIAAGMRSEQLINQQALNLNAKLGQTNQLKLAKNLKLKQVQLNRGYLIPVKETSDGSHYLIGATFDHIANDKKYHCHWPDTRHLQRNLAHWENFNFYQELKNAQCISSHTAVRATTIDHLPICGPVIDQAQFEHDYSDLHHGRHWQSYPAAQCIENLYVLTGLGSRGFTSAPLLADYLVSMITKQPLPLENDLCKIIHPNRFNYRRLKRS